MAEKTWKEKNGWEKTWEVTKVVVSIAIYTLPLFFGRKGAPRPRRRPTTWKPKIFRPKGGPKGWKY